LIAEDLKITREEAIIVRSESSAYGKAIHGSTEEEEKFVAEEKAERERKREEKAEKKRQEEERKAERAAHKKKGKDISIMDLNGDEQPVQGQFVALAPLLFDPPFLSRVSM
jgi:membrane protein involved in colicin uptake